MFCYRVGDINPSILCGTSSTTTDSSSVHGGKLPYIVFCNTEMASTLSPEHIFDTLKEENRHKTYYFLGMTTSDVLWCTRYGLMKYYKTKMTDPYSVRKQAFLEGLEEEGIQKKVKVKKKHKSMKLKEYYDWKYRNDNMTKRKRWTGPKGQNNRNANEWNRNKLYKKTINRHVTWLWHLGVLQKY